MRNLWSVALAMSVVAATSTRGSAQGPGYYGGGDYVGQAGAEYGTGPVSHSGGFSAVGGPVAPGSGGYDQLHPYDGPEPWLHGYRQEIPSYGGFVHFRPYNYKHVLSQSQVAAGWGMSPTMPYSQEIFRRYPPVSNTQARATRRPLSEKTSYDEQVYRAELARLRAQRDFERVHTASQRPAPSETSANAPASLSAPSKTIAPANHVQPGQSRLEDLQEKVREQQRELQSLHDALRRESVRQ